MKKGDILIIVIILTITAASFGVLLIGPKEKYDKKYVEIYTSKKLYKTIPLSNDVNPQTFTIKTSLGINVVRILNGEVKIIDADCPDKICVKDGEISEPGQILVCLPHQLLVEIKGKRNLETDEVSY